MFVISSRGGSQSTKTTSAAGSSLNYLFNKTFLFYIKKKFTAKSKKKKRRKEEKKEENNPFFSSSQPNVITPPELQATPLIFLRGPMSFLPEWQVTLSHPFPPLFDLFSLIDRVAVFLAVKIPSSGRGLQAPPSMLYCRDSLRALARTYIRPSCVKGSKKGRRAGKRFKASPESIAAFLSQRPFFMRIVVGPGAPPGTIRPLDRPGKDADNALARKGGRKLCLENIESPLNNPWTGVARNRISARQRLLTCGSRNPGSYP
jgi:hypothetical protein